MYWYLSLSPGIETHIYFFESLVGLSHCEKSFLAIRIVVARLRLSRESCTNSLFSVYSIDLLSDWDLSVLHVVIFLCHFLNWWCEYLKWIRLPFDLIRLLYYSLSNAVLAVTLHSYLRQNLAGWVLRYSDTYFRRSALSPGNWIRLGEI